MTAQVNECQWRAAAGGLTDFVVASAITGFFTPAQCTNPVIISGQLYYWRAESDDLSQHEFFQGTYTAGTTTVARTTILQSSNSGAQVNFSAAPRVRQVAPSQALWQWIPPGATTGGFVDLQHAAIGNYAAIDIISFGPGDPSLGFTYTADAALVVDNYFSGDLSIIGEVDGLGLFTGVKHTGSSSANAFGQQLVHCINSDSTGPFFNVIGLSFYAFNAGSGNITTRFDGVQGIAEHAGSGTVAGMSGAYGQVFCNGTHGAIADASAYRGEINGSSTPITTASGLHILTSTGSAIVNNYGTLIEDQSGIGGTISENIRSKGASSINTFEGYVVTTGRTVAGLATAAAGNTGARSFVTDSTQTLTAGIGAIVVGLGANKVPVVSDGTNWRIG